LFATAALPLARAAEQGAGAPAMSYDELMQYIVKHKGRVVLISFWATWCGPCLKEIPGLVKLRTDYPEDKLALIGVALDFDPATLASYLRRTNLNFPNYHAGQELMNLMQIHAIPKMLVYDTEGHEVINHAGYIPVEELRPKLDALLPKP